MMAAATITKVVTRHPTTKWGQTKENIKITFKVPDSKDLKIEVTRSSLYFECVSGDQPYKVDLELYDGVRISRHQQCEFKQTGSGVEIKLTKLPQVIEGKRLFVEWPRLFKPETKFPWLKIDFDYIEVIDDEEVKKSAKQGKEKEDQPMKIRQNVIPLWQREPLHPDLKKTSFDWNSCFKSLNMDVPSDEAAFDDYDADDSDDDGIPSIADKTKKVQRKRNN